MPALADHHQLSSFGPFPPISPRYRFGVLRIPTSDFFKSFVTGLGPTGTVDHEGPIKAYTWTRYFQAGVGYASSDSICGARTDRSTASTAYLTTHACKGYTHGARSVSSRSHSSVAANFAWHTQARSYSKASKQGPPARSTPPTHGSGVVTGSQRHSDAAIKRLSEAVVAFSALTARPIEYSHDVRRLKRAEEELHAAASTVTVPMLVSMPPETLTQLYVSLSQPCMDDFSALKGRCEEAVQTAPSQYPPLELLKQAAARGEGQLADASIWQQNKNNKGPSAFGIPPAHGSGNATSSNQINSALDRLQESVKVFSAVATRPLNVRRFKVAEDELNAAASAVTAPMLLSMPPGTLTQLYVSVSQPCMADFPLLRAMCIEAITAAPRQYPPSELSKLAAAQGEGQLVDTTMLQHVCEQLSKYPGEIVSDNVNQL
eukprot:gene17469-23773_t